MDFFRKPLRDDFTPRGLFHGRRGFLFEFFDPSSLFSDAGTIPIVNGDGIYRANDLSGNGHHLSQATSGNRPDWNNAGYATFNGTSDVLVYGAEPDWARNGVIPKQWTVIKMLNAASVGVSDYVFSMGNLANGNTAFAHGSNSATASSASMFIRNDAASPAGQTNGVAYQANVFNATTNVFAGVCDGEPTAPRWMPFLNGVRGSKANLASYGETVFSFNHLAVGCLKRNTEANHMPMNLFAVMLIDAALQDSDIRRVESFWRRRAGL